MCAQQVQTRTLFEDDNLRVSLLPGGSHETIFSFSGLPAQHLDQDHGAVMMEEYLGWASARGGNAVFIQDKRQSWYNTFDQDVLTSVLAPLKGEKTITVGNSMGGFGAILFSGPLGADVCIASAYQYSIHPSVVPEDPRWRYFADRIERFRHPSLEGAFNRQTRFCLFSGEAPLEFAHFSRTPHQENIEQWVVPFVWHDVGPQMKRDGLLHLLLDGCVANTDISTDMRAAYQAFLFDERGRDYLEAMAQGLHEEKKNPAQAETAFRRAMEMNPLSLLAHWRLSNVLNRTGRSQEAQRLRQKGLGLLPKNPWLCLVFAKMLHAEGQVEAARHLARVILDEGRAREEAEAFLASRDGRQG